MKNELSTDAKQAGLELITMSEAFSNDMETWADVLNRNPESETAKLSAGFTSKVSGDTHLEFVIDVQAPPESSAVLRTWAIQTKTHEQGEYFNNIQLTFDTDPARVQSLLDKGHDITREDIRLLLQDQTSHLSRITVTLELDGDGHPLASKERYDLMSEELDEVSADVSSTKQALQTTLAHLKHVIENHAY